MTKVNSFLKEAELLGYRLSTAMIATALLVTVSACMQNWGTRLEFNGGELYYTSSVTLEEATRLGEYMVESGFYDGNEKTVQLTKTGATYEFRMVIMEGLDEDQEYIFIAGMYALELSRKVFDGSPVDIHLCDVQLETLRVIASQ